MKCNKCDYPCPHYHCKICGAQVNNDEKRQEFHPCCSEEHIKIYNNIYNNQNLKIDTNIASFIDHAALKPNTTVAQIRQLCVEAKGYGFASVCVNPTWVSLCYHYLTGTNIKICAVVGFPLGANESRVKACEAKLAVTQGADEIDMVMNISALKSGNFVLVEREIKMVRNAIPRATLKVIIETCLLTEDEKVTACQLAQKAGADFVKTSTGFSAGGATVEDVQLMRKVVGQNMGIKASGFIRTFAEAKALVEAGATRLGCSASVAIVSEAKKGN